MQIAHYRLTCSGWLGTPSTERFQYGLNFVNDGEDGTWGLNDDAWQDIVDDCVAFHGRAATGIKAWAQLDTVKIAHVVPGVKNGHPAMVYDRDPKIFGVNQPGGGDYSNGILPQAALCVSLGTDRRGPSGKGRFYIPAPYFVPDRSNGFRISVEEAEGVRNSAQQWLEAINNNPGIDVVSPQVVIASSKGFNEPVTEVRVGRVIDTMRSRRQALGEAYTANAPVG